MQRDRTSIAKITRPVVSRAIRRKRLFRLLDSGRRKPVIWISGPAGSGKTTLVGSYLDARRLPCLWYQVDEGDADIASFFYYAGLAAKKAAPRKRKPMPLLTPEYLWGIPTFTRRFFEELYRRIGESAKRRSGDAKNYISPALRVSGSPCQFIVVLDNFQTMAEDSSFFEMILNGLAVVPEGINVILVSRGEPPPPFVRLVAEGLMEVIGWNHLRLTHEETTEMMKHLLVGRPSTKAAQMLHEAVQGWAAGLILMIERMKAGDGWLELPGRPVPEEVFEYFASEVFDRMAKTKQDFLIETAFLPKMSPSMASELTGIPQAGEILARLNRKNFFTERHQQTEISYEYHALFKDFLLSVAGRRLSSEDISRLTRTSAALLEKAGYVEDAAGRYIASAEWESLARLILDRAQSFISEGRSKTLEEWLAQMPEELRNGNPWLLYWSGVCRMPFNAGESRFYFEKAFHMFNKEDDRAGALLSWAGAMETIFLERADFSMMDHWIRWLDGVMGDAPSFPSREIEVMVVSGVIGAIAFRMPAYRRKDVWIARAEGLIESDIDVERKMRIASVLYIYYIYMGSHRKFSHMMNILKPAVGGAKLPPLTIIEWHLMKSIHAHMVMASGKECLAAHRDGARLSRETGIRVYDPLLLTIGAYGALTAEEFDEMEKNLSELSSMMGTFGHFDRGNYYCCLLNGDLYRDDIPSALEHGRKMLAAMEKSEAPVPLFLASVGLGQALVEKGDLRKAAEQYSLARRTVRGIRDFDWEVLLLLPEAYMAFKSGNEVRGVALLRKAMAIGSGQRYLNLLYWRPSMMAFLCAKALEEEIEVDYVRELIRRRNLTPPKRGLSLFTDEAKRSRRIGTVPVSLESWPYPLKIYTLGRFEIEKDGKPLVFSGKVQQKPLTMLKALIAFGGRDVSEGQISAALWPEADGDKAYQSFKYTLHALRKLLGSEDFLQLKEGKLTLDAGYCRVDAWVFQGIVENIDSLSGDDKNTPQIITFCEKAIDLFKGDFLHGGETEPWAIAMREKMKGRFVRVLERLCICCEKTGRYDEAVSACQRALETDNLQEEFYKRLMICYLKLGRRADAVRVYNRCKTVLSAVLGVEPSRETEALITNGLKIE